MTTKAIEKKREECRKIELTDDERLLREVLIDIAHRETIIGYAKLLDDYDFLAYSMDNDNKKNSYWNALNKISLREFGYYRPFLSVVVVLENDKIPGNGFYDLFVECFDKRFDEIETLEDRQVLSKEEKVECHKYWSNDKQYYKHRAGLLK